MEAGRGLGAERRWMGEGERGGEGHGVEEEAVGKGLLLR